MPLFHVWFATKRRRWILEGEVSDLVEATLRDVAVEDGIRLLECKTMVDHTHLLLELDSAIELPLTMKHLKGKSARRVFLALPLLKADAQINHLWQRGYGWKRVEPGAEPAVRRYIRTQEERPEKYFR